MSQIDVLEIKVVETCNYNCVGCGSFSNLAKKEEYGIEEIRSDLNRIKSIVDKIRELRLYGGEPLTNPNLLEYVKVSRECLLDSDIVIITNGTLLHKQDDAFFKTLKEYNAKIFVSYYPLNNDIIDQGIEKAKSHNLAVRKADIKYFYVKMLDHEKEGDVTERFQECHAMCKGAVYLDHGILYACPYAPNYRHYDKAFQTHYENKEDGYHIYDENANSIDLAKKMREPLSACRYCDDELSYVNWKQAVPKKENWLCSKDNPYIIHGYKWYNYLEEEKAIDFLTLEIDKQQNTITPRIMNTVDLESYDRKEFYLWIYDEPAIRYVKELLEKEFEKYDTKILGVINSTIDCSGALSKYKSIEPSDLPDQCSIITLYHYYGQRVKVLKEIVNQLHLKLKQG